MAKPRPRLTAAQQAAARERDRKRQAEIRARTPLLGAARNRLNRALAAGTIVRPDVCQKCEQPVDRLWAYFPSLPAHEDVVFMCPPCYFAVRGRKRHKPRSGVELSRKCPSYEVMKRDYVQRGMTLKAMAAAYGVCYASVATTLKKRAVRRGEWPLTPLRVKYGHRMRPDLLRMVVEEWMARPPVEVIVFADAANRHAPYSKLYWGRVREDRGGPPVGHREVWPAKVANFHRPQCRTMHSRRWADHSHEFFALSHDEALDWGFAQCKYCEVYPLSVLAAQSKVSYATWTALLYGRLKVLTKPTARGVLSAIGEPLPNFLAKADTPSV